MAGGRPKKKVDFKMHSLSDDLESVEHVSDEYYRIFNQLAEIDSVKSPDEYFRIEALAEEEWDRSIRLKKVYAPVYEQIKSLVFNASNGLSNEDRSTLKLMMENYVKDSAEFFSEADWVLRVAKMYSKRILRAFKNKIDLEQEYQDIAQQVFMSILTSGNYDYMKTKREKSGYVKTFVVARVADHSRRSKKK
ncbi:MAG: hypothetical protein J0M15_14965 [Deltaproteobacteria bacterium]|nr:hypothetical protein [Deltaproteobacteria bacterium]